MAEPHSVGPMDNCISSGGVSVVIVSTSGGPDNATSVEAAESGYMGDSAVYARGAKGSVCVSTDGSTTHARTRVTHEYEYYS